MASRGWRLGHIKLVGRLVRFSHRHYARFKGATYDSYSVLVFQLNSDRGLSMARGIVGAERLNQPLPLPKAGLVVLPQTPLSMNFYLADSTTASGKKCEGS